MHFWGISQQTLQDEQFMARANSWLASQLADVLAWMLESWPAVTGG
jgi:rhamnogalacturonyl hydrolase YesR